jgi:DNA repair protein RadA/Sms
VEIQALTVPGKAALSRVYSERVEPARVARVAAVLEKHVGLRLSDQDIYVNVSGGIRLSEPGVDLALAAALYSARTGLCLPAGSALAGELSLAGEVRPVRRMAGRARAAKAMGFERVVGPKESGPGDRGDSWEQVSTIGATIRALFGAGAAQAAKATIKEPPA